MKGSETFQLKMYWKKGTEWQGSKKRKTWYVHITLFVLYYRY